MAADEARAQRIRETWLHRKGTDPKRYTWREIAGHVGTSERAAQEWQKTGGIDYDNARALAEYLEVDFDWLWRGPQDDLETPDPFGAARASQVDDGFDEFRQYVRDIRRDIADVRELMHIAQQEREAIMRLLDQQEAILRDLTRVTQGLPADDTLRMLSDAARQLEAAAATGEAGTSGRSTEGRGTRRRPA